MMSSQRTPWTRPICTIALSLLSAHANAQTPAPIAAPVPWTEIAIKSSKLADDRKIFVAIPDGYQGTPRAFAVLILLDADDAPQFGAAIANIRFLTSRRAIQPLIIVGVPNGKDRTHDLTPAATGPNAKQFPTAGGADRFTEFLVDEVMPVVKAQYRTAPYTILAGHSFGGLFAAHVASTHPGVFNAVIAMSPSLWWNDSTVVKSYADGIAHGGASLRFFTTSGGYEGAIDRPTLRFAARLDSLKPSKLAFGHQRYPENSHGLTPMPSLVDGLRFVFQPISLATTTFDQVVVPTSDSATVMRAFAATESAYERGVREFPARELGIGANLPEPYIRQVGTAALNTLHLPNVAAILFARNVELYPQSGAARGNLGDALLARADTAAARTQYAKAIELARAADNTALASALTDKLTKLDDVQQAGRPKP